MHPTAVVRFQRPLARLANPVNTSSGTQTPLRTAPLALLPPIPLYRRLLRAHRRHLGASERVLGDQYVKAEFRAHQKIDNPIQIIGFLTEWQLYAQQVEGDSWRDNRLEQGKFEKLSDEQVYQLYELMQAIQGHEEEGGEGDGNEGGSNKA